MMSDARERDQFQILIRTNRLRLGIRQEPPDWFPLVTLVPLVAEKEGVVGVDKKEADWCQDDSIPMLLLDSLPQSIMNNCQSPCHPKSITRTNCGQQR
jgi:hypothetical protein